ncbi:hypothetical protein [Streptomyces sp. Ru87]|uniref:hypothetical protein n=1 Tax=Streptomyces sp. Ru87 TaxID=2044307 RepID=UPI000BF5FD2E|nr:hypothetical protein [Streptomyces sp. Ru87]PGH52229.1 hypothetical protein CRI70_02520 [Streptomyces sp. Ru87]
MTNGNDHDNDGDRCRNGPLARHRRPEGAGDAAVAAAGKFSEALETTERARGHLYTFHQLTGTADLALDEVLGLLRSAGRDDLAEEVRRELLGRNVLPGRWTFQIVEEYDEGYHRVFRELEQRVRDELTAGRTHVFEAEMKERRRTRGEPGHGAVPGDGE